jgi:hypothetical protein
MPRQSFISKNVSMALPKVLTAAGMFKNIPSSVKPFLKPMLLISLGLHGAVLFIPLPAPSSKAELPKPKPIKIAKLPPLRTPPPKTFSKRLNKKPITPNIVSSIPRKGIVLKQKQGTGTMLPQGQPKADTKPTPPSDPSNAGDRTWNDLPNYSKNIQNPCEGADGCVQTGDSFSEVTQYFKENLSAKKFKFSEENTPTSSYDTEYKAYKVVNKKEVRFLSILSNGDNTKYVWADRIASKEDIVTKTVTPTDIAALIEQLPTQFVDTSNKKLSPERFPDGAISKFYYDKDKPIFGFRNTPANAPIIVSSNPTDTYQILAGKLSSANYIANRIPSGYAGGTLYEITNSDRPKPLYLTIVATKQGDGSIVALWLDMPK